jgi:hypothetical protein
VAITIMKPHFCDLSIPILLEEGPGHVIESSVKERVLRAFMLGYSTVAVDVWVSQDQLKAEKVDKPKAKRARKDKVDKPKAKRARKDKEDTWRIFQSRFKSS